MVGVGRVFGLFVERALENLQQPCNFTEVALLRAFDRGLGQVVAQHELRVDAVHAGGALGVLAGLCRQPGAVAQGPGIEGLAVDEEIARGGVGPGQAAKGDREVGAGGGHQAQQVVDQGLVVILFAGQAELGAQRGEHRARVLGLVRLQRGQQQLARRLGRALDGWQQRLRQRVQVPERHARLAGVGVAALMVAVVADVAGVEGIEKAERAVVDRQPQQGHVVGVHHAVAKPDGLPLRHQARGAQRHLTEQGRGRLVVAEQGRKVARHGGVEQLP